MSSSLQSNTRVAVSGRRGPRTGSETDLLPSVSVVIPVRNNIAGITRCLTAIADQTYPDELYQTIVVDNGSTEDVKSAVERFAFARYITVAQTGAYSARNRGIEESTGELLAFTDSDCIPDRNWIAHGVAKLIANPDLGMVAGRVDLFTAEQPTIYEEYDKLFYLDQESSIRDKNFGATASMFARRSVFETVGMFEEGLKSSGDFEWGKRVHASGIRQGYVADSIVRHPARSSARALRRRHVRITGGLHDLRRLSKDHRLSVRDRLAALKMWSPPIAQIKYSLRQIDTPTFGDKVRLTWLILSLHYSRRFEFLRLGLGGRSRNY